MITVLGTIVTLLLTVNFGKPSGANLGFLLHDAGPKDKFAPLLAALDAFQFWLVGVMSVGLARLAGVRFARAFLLVAGYWLLQQCVLVSLSLLAAGMAGGFK
jgi:hypothetical protein